jgi:hypothetical protein
MISFLLKRGYDVLNLVELRKPLDGEALTEKITVGSYEYRYRSSGPPQSKLPTRFDGLTLNIPLAFLFGSANTWL